jgi:hypothetical protein
MQKLEKDLGREGDKLGGHGSSSKHPLERSPMQAARGGPFLVRHFEILIIAPVHRTGQALARSRPPPRDSLVDRRKWYDKPVISFGPGPLD